MSKINIKIVEVDQSSHSVLVKYTSERSQKPIDEYSGVVFQVSNYVVKNLDEFIEAIRPQVSLYVWQRDQAENPAEPVDMSNWEGYSAQVDAYELPAAPLADIQLPPNANPEITV
jgi:hypothetical protein